jgi:hypothetical protein
MYHLFLYIGVGLILFTLLAAPAVSLLWWSRHRHRPAGPQAPPAQAGPQPEGELTQDEDLLKFFRAVDPRFERQFPSLARGGGEPRAGPSASTPSLPVPDASPAVTPREVKPAFAGPEPVAIGERPMPKVVRVIPDPVPVNDEQPAPSSAADWPGSHDPNWSALGRLWPQLSPRDRRELLLIAQMKLHMSKPVAR